MRAVDPIPTGFAPSEPWPSEPGPVALRRGRSPDTLTALPDGSGWACNPYQGCQFACIYCRAREQAPFADADVRLFDQDIGVRINAAEAVARALRDGLLEHKPLVLGTSCDPWQPAEKQAQITRCVLEVLACWGGRVELRAQTRSTLVGRDIDLFRAIGAHGKVAVSVSLATLDTKLARLLEPLAPTPERRLVAMEALARAGVKVGVSVAPVIAGLTDDLGTLEKLLRRAKSGGASFASVAPLSMSEASRRKLVAFVSRHDPERATRYRRLLARCVECEPSFAEGLAVRFAAACKRVGIEALENLAVPPPARSTGGQGPRQLSLFDAERTPGARDAARKLGA